MATAGAAKCGEVEVVVDGLMLSAIVFHLRRRWQVHEHPVQLKWLPVLQSLDIAIDLS